MPVLGLNALGKREEHLPDIAFQLFVVTQAGHAPGLQIGVEIYLVAAFLFTQQQATAGCEVVPPRPDLQHLVILSHHRFGRGIAPPVILIYLSLAPGKEVAREESVVIALAVIPCPVHVEGLSGQGGKTPLVHVRQAVVGLRVLHGVFL